METGNTERLKEHGGNIRQLAARLGIDPNGLVDFSSNINPYGPSEGVIGSVKQALDKIHEYPEQQAESLVWAIAQSLGVEESNVVAGNGTTELIHLIPKVFKVGKALLIIPSFTEYELSLCRSGADIVYKEAFSGDDAMKLIGDHSRNTSIAMIGNPNNPCGYSIEKDRLIEAVDSYANCLWVIDEAFIDFMQDGSGISLARDSVERDNLIVLRSLTKMYSIPGLRLGYMVASTGIAAKVREEKYPWSVNTIALAAGLAALEDDTFINHSVGVIASEARRLYKGLSEMNGLIVYEPAANYILVKIESGISSHYLQRELLRRGVAVRDCSSYTGMDDRHFRVAVKRPEDNDRLLAALRDIFYR